MQFSDKDLMNMILPLFLEQLPVLNMGVIGIAIAMCCDWSIQAVFFIWSVKSGKWKAFQVV